MKFLIDAQLPHQICRVLKNNGFNAIHVESLPEGDESPDQDITVYADEHDLMVMTKDSDFYHSHMILNHPESLFLVTTGNIKNRDLFNLIQKNVSIIKKLVNTCNYIEYDKQLHK